MRVLMKLAMVFVAVTNTVAADEYRMDDALRTALQHNPELLAQEQQLLSAQEATGAAYGALLPQVDLHYQARRSDNPLDAFADKLNTRSVSALDLSPGALNSPQTSTLHTTELALVMPVYTGGKLSAGIRQARENENAAQLDYAHTREDLALRVRQAYLSAQASHAGLAIADAAVAAASEHVLVTGRLVREGRIAASDKMTAELNLAAMQSAREQAHNQMQQALDKLQWSVGGLSDFGGPLPAWQTPPEIFPENNDPRGLEQQALLQRKDLLSLRAQGQAGQAQVDQARAAYKPQLSLVAASRWYEEQAGLDNHSQTLMGVVSMNLFNGGRDAHTVASSRFQTREIALRIQALEQRIRYEIRSALGDLNAARARYRIAEQNVDKAVETVHLVKKRYGEGRTLLIDVLLAERVLVETRQEALQAGLQRAVSGYALAFAVGQTGLPE